MDADAARDGPASAVIQSPTNGPDEAPPSYDCIVDSQLPSEPPPTYDSLFGNIQRTRKESNGCLDFLKNLLILLLSTVGCVIFLALLLAIPITCIVLGAKYKDDCTIQPKIPIYLIVLGSFGVFRNIIGLFNQGKKRLQDVEDGDAEEESNTKKSTFEGTIDFFLIIWFICGNVWVYHNYIPNYHDMNSPQYCHNTLYLFAFWLNTSVYIFIGTCCCCFCFIGICAAIVSDDDEE